MEKVHFFMKLVGPRPSFAFDMNAEERALMMEHAKYFAGLTQQGICVIAGPVFATEGSFGIGVLEVESREEAERICAADPTVVAGMNRIELSPMKMGFLRGVKDTLG